MKQSYQIVDRSNSQELAGFLSHQGQFLLPMVELIEQSRLAVDELIEVTGRATIEEVLRLSAQRIAGVKHPGKKTQRQIGWHGSQRGVVSLSQRQLRITKPRLRRRRSQDAQGGVVEAGEVEIPAYQAMRDDPRLGERMLNTLLHGVSTRSYQQIIPEMAQTVGVSKSAVSREAIEAGEAALKALCERRFDQVDLLVIYIDGQIFGEHHILTAVGVDSSGAKHVLGLREGASENAVVVTALLEDLVQRGVTSGGGRRRLFVIDGSKALRCGIDAVFGSHNPVQRCRKHKMANVIGHLPDDQHDQVRQTMKAAYRLGADEGLKKLRTLASWLEREHPSAASSLLEGLEETFTINRLGLPAMLQRCLATTNLIESPQSGVRMRTRRVTHWQGGAMVQRWAAAAWLATEAHFKRIMGYQQLWMLKARLDHTAAEADVVNQRKAG
jgi:transposase-like protein